MELLFFILGMAVGVAAIYNCLSQVTVNKIPYTESDNAAGGKTVTIG